MRKEEQDFRSILKEQNLYKQIILFMQWDIHTNIPRKGLNQRLDALGFVSEKLYQLNTSDRMKSFIDQYKGSQENEFLRKMAIECEAIYEKNIKIPQKFQIEFLMLKSESEVVWQEARNKSDFTLFQPYLEKMVNYNKQMTDFWGYEDHLYDALLQNYEPGINTKTVDQLFNNLQSPLSKLLGKINSSKHKVDDKVIKTYFPEKDQEALCHQLLGRIGFNQSAGRLDTSVHPYTFAFQKDDVRITTRYNPYDFREAVFGALHEGGHALYEQNFSDELTQTPLAEVSSMGMHESQAIFWESFIGRNQLFWEANNDLFAKYAPTHLKQLSMNTLYKSIHEVKPSLIRVDADEVTYPFHIMIRYELEKALLSSELAVKDLPSIWNEKMYEYLGIQPQSDREGVLQDIHWASGDFGYFPTYTIGYLYAAQIYYSFMRKVNLDELLRANHLTQIVQWLTENIYQFGKQKGSQEIIKDVTNEDLNGDYFIKYLTEKYSRIYQF